MPAPAPFTVPLPDGRHLYAVAQGEGSPTVVFESGMGASRLAWCAVAPAVAEHTRTVVYDRAGFGESPVDPEPRTLERLVTDFVALVDHLDDERLVLVAHSWGGPIVRIATTRRPDRVAALVLVDQTDEACDLYHRPATQKSQRHMAQLLPLAQRVGLLRFLVTRATKPLPPELAASVRDGESTRATARGMEAEMRSAAVDLEALRDDPPVLPDIPVTLISGTKRVRFAAAQRTALVQAHRDRAAALPQGKHVEASGSAHLVAYTEPDLVVTEVLQLVDAVRTHPHSGHPTSS